MVHGHEDARSFSPKLNAGIGSKLDGGGRANVEGAALGQIDLGRGSAGGHGAIRGNDSLAIHHLKRARDHGGAARDVAIERDNGNRLRGNRRNLNDGCCCRRPAHGEPVQLRDDIAHEEGNGAPLPALAEIAVDRDDWASRHTFPGNS